MATPAFFGPEFHVNTTNADDQDDASVTALANGKFVAVWDDLGHGDVRGQLFNADGSRGGDEFIVSTTSGGQFDAAVTGLTDGRFVVAWTQVLGFTDKTAVTARIFDVGGHPTGDEITVNTTTGKPVFDPAIAALTSGGFAVTWTREFSGVDRDVLGRAFDAAGKPLGSDFPIDTNGANLEFQSSVVGLANGNYAVVWQDAGHGTDTDGSGSHIRAAIVSGNGNVVVNPFIVNTTTANDQSEPSVALLSNGNFIVTWTNEFSADDVDVRGRVFTPAGVPIGGDFIIDGEGGEDETQPAVTALANGTFAASWTNSDGSIESDGSGSHVRAQIFDGTAGGKSTLSGEFVANTTTHGDQGRGTLATLADGRVVATWTDFGDNPGDPEFGIRAQIFDPRTAAVHLEGKGLNDDWVGTRFADILNGHGGKDHIDGGAGGDFINGGADDDNLIGGEGADQLFGDAGSDRLDGGTGNDVLNGFTGADRMIGGAGDDFYFVDNTADVIIENPGNGFDTVLSSVSFTLSSNVEKLALDGAGGAINGTGNTLANTLLGNTFDNVLDGGAGADTMSGDLGNDTFIVDNLGDRVSEESGGGSDLVKSSVSFALGANVEKLTLTGAANINGTGNGLANTMIGNAGKNTLDGGAGADTMKGLAGNDVYVVDNAGDIVDETGGSGVDSVRSSISFSLTDSAHAKGVVENLTLVGPVSSDGNAPAGGPSGTGNDLANTIVGNSAGNLLSGGKGKDVLHGEGGIDTLVGGKGKDFLDGGLGDDILKGGRGKDHFIFATGLNATLNVDTVKGFKLGDVIELDNAIFSALAKTGHLKGGFFEVGKHAGDHSDHIIYNQKTGKLFYDADGKGGAAQIEFAILGKHLDLTSHDFLVV